MHVPQLGQILDNIQPHAIGIATNIHGTRSVQKLIERSIETPSLIPRIIPIVKGFVAQLVTVLFHIFQLNRIAMVIM